MGNLIKMFFSQPEIALQLLLMIPAVIAVVFLIRLGYNISSISKERTASSEKDINAHLIQRND